MTVSTSDALNARDDLIWVADRWPDLRARLRPGGGAKMDGGRSAPSSRPPIDVHVSDLMFEVAEHARFLGQVLMEESNDWQPRTSAMPQLLRDVAERYGHFTAVNDRTALDFCDQAHEFRRKVSAVLHRPPAPTYMGDCPAAGCEGDLYVKGATTRMVCPECKLETDIYAQREWVATKLTERLMTQSEIISALTVIGTPVPENTIKTWVHRKRLIPVEDEPALYRLVDAMALAEGRKGRIGA